MVATPTSPVLHGGAATRSEHDSMGAIDVPAQALWGAQTQRSLRYFAIGEQRMPLPLIHAMAQIKGAVAEVHGALGALPAPMAAAIAAAAARVAAGECDDEFPLCVWQTGSGTQSHMNVNEVIAHLASLALGGRLDDTAPRVHPNDHVNRGQSSNDVFPSAMHIAALLALRPLWQALAELRAALQAKAALWADVIKVGRTHLQDATPITFGQELGGHDAQLALAEAALRHALPAVRQLALGGTAVGTGLNSRHGVAARAVALLAERLDEPLVLAPNAFAALAGHEPLVALHAGLRGLAIALNKIGNDIRLLGSGPRAGLGELHLPENEPGSSMMPGKVNPTQIEALTMVCAQVMGHDVALGIGASQGQLELNVYKPLIALNLLDSTRLLTDAMAGLSRHCIAGLQLNADQVQRQLDRSLMRVTALVPHIGHARAAQIAQLAQSQGLSLREAALADGGLSAAEFDAWADPRQMLAPRD